MKAPDKESSSRKSSRKKSSPTKSVGLGAPDGSVSVVTDDGTVSDDAALFLLAKEAVLRSGETGTVDAEARRRKVEQLKKALAEGSYSADARAVAEKVLEAHLDHDFGKNRL
jgi:anti-sigma28 factor (negative regulator of flagellin synthesis)